MKMMTRNYKYWDDDFYWSCDVCGGDSETGCMMSDTGQCQR